MEEVGVELGGSPGFRWPGVLGFVVDFRRETKSSVCLRT